MTASKHHIIYTKTNSVLKATRSIKLKTTPMVAEIIFGKSTLHGAAVQWGIEKEHEAFKSFYAHEVSKHKEFGAEKCGIFLSKFESYIAGSPDGILYLVSIIGKASSKLNALTLCETKTLLSL